MSSDLAHATSDELEAALQQQRAAAADAQAELARREAARNAALTEQQAAWDLDLTRKHRSIDACLEQQWMDLSRQGEQAAKRGDLLAAVGAWVQAADVRRARAIVRQEARASATRQGVEHRVVTAELRSLDLDLFARFERLAESGNDTRAQAIMTQLIGNYPTELDDDES